jgi:hypothetical protein
MVPQIVEVEIAKSGSAGCLAKDPADVNTAVRAPVRAREQPFVLVVLELTLNDLPSCFTQDDRPSPALGARKQHNTLLKVNHLSTEAPYLPLAHQG